MENVRDEIIYLNVGGKRMTTTSSTLCQIKGSSLENYQKTRDKDGLIFLDFNPKQFARILDYLRAKRVSTPDNTAPLPIVGSSEIESFKHLVQHLGLFNEFFPTIKETFLERSREIRLDENGTKAVFLSHTTTSNAYWHVSEPVYVFGKHIYDLGVFRLKLQLHWNGHMNNHNSRENGIDVGFIKGICTSEFCSVSGRPIDEVRNPNFIGWNVGRNRIFHYGKDRNHSGIFGWGSDQRYTWKDGDIIELLLDMNAAVLFLNPPNGLQFQTELPKWIKLRLCVRFKYPDTGLKILEIRKEG